MLEIYSILAILIGAGLLYFGLKWYGTSLAVSFFVPIFMLLTMIDYLTGTALIILIVVSAFILFLSRPLTYFVAWVYISVSLLSLISIIGIENGVIQLISMILAIVIVRYIKTHLRAVIIGISGGLCIALGLSTFIFGGISSFAGLQESNVGLGILTLLSMIGGIAFQYLYIIPNQDKNPDEEPTSEPVDSDEDSK